MSAELEGWLEGALGVASAAFGIQCGVEVRTRTASGRTVVRATLTQKDPAPLSPRRWLQVTSALQALAEAGAVARGLGQVVVEVSPAEGQELPAPVTGQDDALARAVRTLARRVAAQGRSVAIGPMSPAERRVLHEALGEVPEVWAQSDGEGIMRRLWVMPRKA
jgi:predicted RNA-binding protein Jag